MTKRFGFTLAEVLITLGIIGVVAAMTMPTLINQTNGAQYKAAYKKALSAISQAITLNVALEDKSFANSVASSTTEGTVTTKSTEDFLKKRMNVVGTEKGANDAGYTLPNNGVFTINSETLSCTDEEMTDQNTTECNGTSNKKTVNTTVTPDVFLFFNDSSMFGYVASDHNCKSGSACYGIIDVNGAKGPNRLTEDADVINDIYIVEYFDQTIRPATDAAAAVLYGK